MKEIKAYIKAIKRDEVTNALHRIKGLQGASFSNVLGFGRSKEMSSGHASGSDVSGYVKHVKVEVVCDAELESAVVEAIHRAAHTGLRGDGRIFVSDIGYSIRIQEDPEARPSRSVPLNDPTTES
ncbi:MAG: P-II family nitrogen regulator [Opitutaceae bacterium]